MQFRFPAFVGVFLLAGPAVAEASIISTTPTLPLLDTPYTTSTALGCVAAIDTCRWAHILSGATAISRRSKTRNW